MTATDHNMKEDASRLPDGAILGRLVHPLLPHAFLEGHWPEQPYWTADAEMPWTVDNTELVGDVERLVLSYGAPVSVLSPQGISARLSSPADALIFYRQGFTLYFRRVDACVPALSMASAYLAAELGVPASCMSVEIFCSLGVSGVSMHSDYDMNFQYLLRGCKHWTIAKNENIRFQTGVCLPNGHEQRDSRQLALADRLPLPSFMPPGAREIDLAGGSTIFLPRGWWHETRSLGDCFAVNFVVKGPQWREILRDALDEILIQEPQWRAFALGIVGSAGAHGGDSAAATFAGLVEMLRRKLGDMPASEIAAYLLKTYLRAKGEIDAGDARLD